MIRFLLPYFILSSFANDIASLVQNSQKAAASYKDEALDFVQQSQKSAHPFKNEILKTPRQPTNACQKPSKLTPSCQKTHPLSLKEEGRDYPLKIFVSSSMPKESLRALHQQANKVGARLIFRGLINNSFKETQAYFKDLGITADIDPVQFEDHHITQVPTFVLGEHQLQGNISLEEAVSYLRKTRS